MSALSDVRTVVAQALAGVGVTVYEQPPQSLALPSVVLYPGGPWIEPRGNVTLRVVAYVTQVAGTAAALTALEDLVQAVRDDLWAAGIAPQHTDVPDVDPDKGTLSAQTWVTLRTHCH